MTSNASPHPRRGEVWLADLDPVRGHEQVGGRPCVVVSSDHLNHGPAEIIVILPITSTQRPIPLHVAVTPPDGGLTRVSDIKVEDVRSISIERLVRRLGTMSALVMRQIEERLRLLFELGSV